MFSPNKITNDLCYVICYNGGWMKLVSLLQILVTVSLFYFFSCAPKGEGILNNKSSFSESVDYATLKAPFAYDIAADTISYNSCINYEGDISGLSPVPALTIGVNEGFVTSNGNGAVKGGLKLKTDFLQFVGRYFKPLSPSPTITPSQVQSILANSPNNQNAYLQYSIRRKTDLVLNVDRLSPGAGNANSAIPVRGRDATVFLQDLSSGYLGYVLTKDISYTQAGTVLSEGSRTYNFSDTPTPVLLQGSFGLNQTTDETAPIPNSDDPNPEIKFGYAELYSHKIRERFNSNSSDKVMLTAVFGGKAQDTLGGSSTEETISQIRRSGTDVSKAYGRAYTLKFQPKVNGISGWLSNVLSGTAVTEIDLLTGTNVPSTWSCQNFLIVLSSHYDNKKLNEPTCSPLMEEDLKVGNRLQAVKKIRRQHSATDWNIGLFIPKDAALGVTLADRIAKRATYELCVSPRRSRCYLPTTEIFSLSENLGKDAGVQYDTTKECYLTAHAQLSISYTNAATADAKRLLGRCPQYLSVCTRTSTNF